MPFRSFKADGGRENTSFHAQNAAPSIDYFRHLCKRIRKITLSNMTLGLTKGVSRAQHYCPLYLTKPHGSQRPGSAPTFSSLISSQHCLAFSNSSIRPQRLS